MPLLIKGISFMHAQARTFAALASLVVGVGGSVIPSQAEPQVYLAPFYANTSKFNPQGQPLGKVLASEPAVSTVPGSKAWRIVYVSSDGADRPTVVTALIAVPDAPAPVGGRRLVAWAHGTTGTARRCGPSQMDQPAQPLNQILLPSGTSYNDFGLPAMEVLIQKGYVIVATDYQGLGGPGDHQYAQNVSNGRDVINALRAARNFKPAQAGEKAIVYGWSQGGGATIGAAGQGAYAKAKGAVAPIDLLGFIAMAPQDTGIQIPSSITTEADAATLIQALNHQFSNNIFNFTHLVMMYWGLAAAQPGLNLGDLLTPQATAQINDIMRRKCIHELSASFSYSYGNTYKQMLKASPINSLAWVKAIQRQAPGLKPMAPVVIYWGNEDDVVPPVMHKLYFEAACRQGAVMSRIELPGNNTHFSTPAAAEPFYLAWMDDRFNGKPIRSGCPIN
jgi:pimeloyl-ACP methyl ester carboxylesterase